MTAQAFAKPETPLLAALAVALALCLAAASAGAVLRVGAPASTGDLGFDPFRSDRAAVHESYCRRAIARIAPDAHGFALREIEPGNAQAGLAPAVVLVSDADTIPPVRCEFVPENLIDGHARLSAVVLGAAELPMETLDAINTAIANAEQAYR